MAKKLKRKFVEGEPAWVLEPEPPHLIDWLFSSLEEQEAEGGAVFDQVKEKELDLGQIVRGPKATWQILDKDIKRGRILICLAAKKPAFSALVGRDLHTSNPFFNTVPPICKTIKAAFAWAYQLDEEEIDFEEMVEY